MLGRVGARRRCELTEVARFRNGGVRLPDGLYWDVLGLYLDILAGVRAAARTAARAGGRLAGIGIDSWAVDYGLVGPRRRAARQPAALPGLPHRGGRRRRPRQGRPGAGCTRSPGCSSCRSTRSTSSPPTGPGLPRGRRPGPADPRPARLLAHRRPGRRGDQRLHHRTAGRPHRRLVAPSSSRPSACRPGCCRTSSPPGSVLGDVLRRGAGRARHRARRCP